MTTTRDEGSVEGVHATYTEGRRAREGAAARARSVERLYGAGRLVTFLAGAWLTWTTFVDGRFSPLVLAVPAVVFVWLVIRHNGLIRSRERCERAAAFHADGIARLSGRWRSPHDGRALASGEHPYAEDLDVVGPEGLFARICTARTARGREILGTWLTEPSAAGEIRARHAAVRELTGRLDLREALALLGEENAPHLEGARLVVWGEAPRVLHDGRVRILAAASSVLTVVALVALLRGAWPLLAPIALVIHLGIGFATQRRTRAVLGAAEEPARELSLLAAVTERLDVERFDAARLRALGATLRSSGRRAAAEIRTLTRHMDLVDSARNQLFGPIAWILHWHLHLAHAVDAWRLRHGAEIRSWMDATGEMEALSVLAGHAFENPLDPFPEIEDTGPLFDARGLGHPFLSRERCVTNDVRLDGTHSLLVVSGSNMSGKSTLLRSVGINAVLAMAGAPVRARSLSIAPVAVGASLRVADSLADGRSRFLAEVERLKALVDISRDDRPLLFLVDELLQGTNSHDRRIGAEAVMRTLMANGAIGILTTHDLALTEIAESLAGARNAHFQDHLEDGEMAFDYTLRPGVVEKSNAVALMRRVGLDV